MRTHRSRLLTLVTETALLGVGGDAALYLVRGGRGSAVGEFGLGTWFQGNGIVVKLEESREP